MSTEMFRDIDIGVADMERLMRMVVHATPDELEMDPDISRHLNDGGVVIIHCEVDEPLRWDRAN